jgi:indole-3-glycerol phosphate synthase
MRILNEILAHKRGEIEIKKRTHPFSALAHQLGSAKPPMDFVAALRRGGKGPALIAECKRASPSRGALAMDLDVRDLAHVYAENGASAVSVLTDERYFHGCLDDLQQIADSGLEIPLLRKDFVLDPYQVYEARAAGADAVLLIVSALEKGMLVELHQLVLELGMAALVEVHDRQEIALALTCEPKIIGINNRNLQDFSVRLATSLEFCPDIPEEICKVAESGIHTADDVRRLADVGVDAILVGEALVTAKDIPAKVRSLVWIDQTITM